MMRELARWLSPRHRGERGQTSTEYVLTIAVLAVGLVAATSAFTDKRGPFHQGMKQLSRGISTVIAEEPSTTGNRP